MKYLIVILCSFVLCVHGKPQCEKFLRELSHFDAEFTQCASNNAVPVTFCEKCKLQYDNMTKSYNSLREAVDEITNTSCKDLYFDKDRLNIIERVYEELNGLWERAYCQECYNALNETNEISRDIDVFETCINANKKDPCVSCKGDYVKMNDFYNNIINRYEGKVCFDIQDKMNRSRVMWSKDLKCCQRETNLVAFAAVSSALMILPIIFYGSLIVRKIRAERNHGTLDNNNTGDNTTSITRSDTNPPPTNSISEDRRVLPSTTIQNLPSSSPSQRSLPKIPSKKKVLNSDSSESSDDDLLLGSKQKHGK